MFPDHALSDSRLTVWLQEWESCPWFFGWCESDKDWAKTATRVICTLFPQALVPVFQTSAKRFVVRGIFGPAGANGSPVLAFRNDARQGMGVKGRVSLRVSQEVRDRLGYEPDVICIDNASNVGNADEERIEQWLLGLPSEALAALGPMRRHPHSEEKLLSTQELAEATAGGDDYIRTRDNIVKGLALRTDINPNAPRVVAYGSGPRIVARAERLMEQGVAVPAYVKRDVNAWAFVGHYRAIKNLTDKASIRRYAGHWPAGRVAGVLLLERTDVEEIEVRGGGFADAETRKAVEKAAVGHVTEVLEAEGFEVEDRQAENCGFDLLATRDGDCLEVEVKGTSGVARNFFITRNETEHAEKSAKKSGNWRLYLVTRALDEPTLHRYTWSELQDSFEMKALAWQCKAKESQAPLKDNAK